MTCIHFFVQAEIVFSNITAETKDVSGMTDFSNTTAETKDVSGMTDFSNTTVITAETIALTLGITEQLATATKAGIEELESIFPRDLNTTNYVLDSTIDLLIRSLGEKVYIHVCVHSQTIISLHMMFNCTPCYIRLCMVTFQCIMIVSCMAIYAGYSFTGRIRGSSSWLP